MKTLSKHGRLGIAQQFDYSKFLLYSLITQSTAIEGSTVTEVENQLLFDEGIPPEKHNLSEVMMNLDLLNAYQMSIQLANQHRDYSFEMLRALSTAVLKNTGSRYNTALGTFDSSKGDFRKVNVSAGSSGKSYLEEIEIPNKRDGFWRRRSLKKILSHAKTRGSTSRRQEQNVAASSSNIVA